MVFGDVIAVEPGFVVGLDEPQAVVEQFFLRDARVVEMVEHAEFHVISPGTLCLGIL